MNPFEVGFIGGTDTHNGTSGAVSESDFAGHVGIQGATPQQRLGQRGQFGMPGAVMRNPGGLAGVWAEENSRDALFDAMRRREAFATSGPRIQPRLFVGSAIPDDLCERSDFAAVGYSHGVPMGGSIGREARTPRFAVRAQSDPGTQAEAGGLLERIQIIKVWSEGDGSYGQAVFDVAGEVHAESEVDFETCEPAPVGSRELCAVWEDPEFDAEQSAAYYARILEVPSCRWSHRDCLRLEPDDRPPSCSDPSVPRAIRERAWTSPVWYSPDA